MSAYNDIIETAGATVQNMFLTTFEEGQEIGQRIATEARRRWGGCAFYVPTAERWDVVLCKHAIWGDIIKAACAAVQERIGATEKEGECFGKAIADVLVLRWGGLNVYISKTNHEAMCAKHAAIMQALRGGASYADAALQFGLSAQRIRQIERKARGNAKASAAPPEAH